MKPKEFLELVQTYRAKCVTYSETAKERLKTEPGWYGSSEATWMVDELESLLRDIDSHYRRIYSIVETADTLFKQLEERRNIP